MTDLPSYVWALTLVGAIGIPLATSFVLHRAAVAAGLSRPKATGIAVAAAAVLGGWLALSALLARSGAYIQESGQVRPLLGIAVTGVFVGTLAATRIPVLSRILARPATLSLLAIPHTLRIAGIVFLTAMVLGRLPAVFALPAGLGDIAIGIAAPLVARRLARGDRRGVTRFHLLGIADLVVALAIGYLAGLGPLHLLEVTPSMDALGMLPLTLVPTVAVPLTITLHIVSLRRLRAAAPTAPLTPAGSR